LDNDGLGYATAPKGLIPFHAYPDGAHTAWSASIRVPLAPIYQPHPDLSKLAGASAKPRIYYANHSEFVSAIGESANVDQVHENKKL
jgi:hypothetical protein